MRICILLSALLCIGHATFCQNLYKMGITDNYLIKNALVVAKPGSPAVKQDILVEHGIIKMVSPNQKLPLNTIDLTCDSIYVYAGFIGGASYIGVKAPEEKKDAPKPPSRDEGTMEQSGITPQASALTYLSSTDKGIEEFRNAGFTVSQIFPKGGMIPGQSAVITLKPAKVEDEMVISNPKNLLSTFVSSRTVAPSTQIGVMARYRDLYKNAELADKNNTTYTMNPVGMKAPVYSEEIAALIPYQKKERPVYFVAPKTKDIFRAVAMQKELGYKLVLTDVKYLGDALETVKAGKFPVILSLTLPTKEDAADKKKDAKGKDDAKPKEEAKEEVKEKKETSPEVEALKLKKEEAIKAYEAQAGKLEKAGIPFAFSVMDTKVADISKNLQRMIEGGLTSDGALAALTTSPASMLGLSKTHGTIENGKIANLVFMDKPFFEKESKIKMVMVEGKLFEGITKDKPAPGEKSTIEGNWSYTTIIQASNETGVLKLKKTASGYSGVIVSDQNPSSENVINDLTIKDQTLTGYITMVDNGNMRVDFELAFDGAKFSGKLNLAGIGKLDISGTKKPDNNEN